MQGLASISDNDVNVKEYFDNFQKHKKLFYWEDVSYEKAIKMAFGKEEKDIEKKRNDIHDFKVIMFTNIIANTTLHTLLGHILLACMIKTEIVIEKSHPKRTPGKGPSSGHCCQKMVIHFVSMTIIF